jgi:1,2-diacylglycerol 3-beta-glucosyltransferase
MLVAILLAVVAIPPALASGYLFLLTLLSGRREAPRSRASRTHFDVVVPAHDEEAGIAATIESLRAVAYPCELYRVVVVADNCSDRTASVAQRAGALVLSRNDSAHPGKGRALAYAFDRAIAEDRDAVVVVDADTVVSPNLLEALDARLQAGARAIQSDYAVRNAGASWRTLLMALALGSFHRLRSLGRERLGVSCGLRGNGMCFSASLLREVRHEAFSIVEDLEYGLHLGEAGHRVVYAPEAHVFGEMVTRERDSRSQRRRWEGGRAAMRRHGWSLFARAFRRRNGMLLDLALDVLVPPLSTLAGAVALGALGACLLATRGRGWETALCLTPWSFCVGCLTAYVLRGWQLSGTGWRGMASLLHAPAYLAWKLMLPARAERGHAIWQRTAREGAETALASSEPRVDEHHGEKVEHVEHHDARDGLA